jgi:hypothetical protein
MMNLLKTFTKGFPDRLPLASSREFQPMPLNSVVNAPSLLAGGAPSARSAKQIAGRFLSIPAFYTGGDFLFCKERIIANIKGKKSIALTERFDRGLYCL